MPLVFVHGVNVRNDPSYVHRVAARDTRFRRFVMSRLVDDPASVTIQNPYWGDLAGALAWDGNSLPAAPVPAFGAEEDELAETLLSELAIALPEDPEAALLEIARQSLPDAVDTLLAIASEAADPADQMALTALAAKTIDYALYNPSPTWLDDVQNDLQFFAQLRAAVNVWPSVDVAADDADLEAFGVAEVWDRVREGLSRVRSVVQTVGSGLVLATARKPLHATLVRFLGDLFTYLKERGAYDAPGPIIKRITDDLEAAQLARNDADPHLIVVGHSMGGNILYDIFSHFRPDLRCDVFVTVGSQVGLFEELKLFQASDPDIPSNPTVDRVQKPANIGNWLNVFDGHDVLSFVGEPIFSGITDFKYTTGKGLLSAHSTYFVRPSFHAKLGKRLEELMQ